MSNTTLERKTAKDKIGKTISVGDTVACFSIYSSEDQTKEMSRRKVLCITAQGYDGTILHLDGPPNPEYPYHYLHVAKYTRKIVK